MSSITDRINAAHRTNVNGRLMIDLDQVLDIVATAVPVEIDSTMYSTDVTDGLTDDQRVSLAVVCTVYNLMADTAARFAAMDVRRQMEVLGVDLISDEELFASESDEPGFPRSYRDLAIHDADELLKVGAIFEKLVNDSTFEAFLGMMNSLAGDR